MQNVMLPLNSLGHSWQDQQELATLLQEGGFNIEHFPRNYSGNSRSHTPRHEWSGASLKERVQAAEALDISPDQLDWSRMRMAIPTELLAQRDALLEATPSGTPQSMQIDLNSGGKVFFCLFSPQAQAGGTSNADAHRQHRPSSSTRQASDISRTSTYPLLPDPPPRPKSNISRHAPGGRSHGHLGQPHGRRDDHASVAHAPGPPRPREGIVVLKFCGSRLLAQAEQLAGELARHCGVAAPDSRVIHQIGPTAKEWESLEAAAGALCVLASSAPSPTTPRSATSLPRSPNAQPTAVGTPSALSRASSCDNGPIGGQELIDELRRVPAALVMSHVAGFKFCNAPVPPGQDAARLRVLEELGRLFVLDMVLGNADRLPCADLGWRGNTDNLLFGKPGGRHAGRPVAIDACVQRRPPQAKLDREDVSADRVAQLVLSDTSGEVVLPLLRDQLLAPGPPWLLPASTSYGRNSASVAAFKRGMRWCLERVVALKGLFETVHAHITTWVSEFLLDIKDDAPNVQLPSPMWAGSAHAPSSSKSGSSPATGSSAALRYSRSVQQRSMRSPRDSAAGDDLITPVSRRITADAALSMSSDTAGTTSAAALRGSRAVRGAEAEANAVNAPLPMPPLPTAPLRRSAMSVGSPPSAPRPTPPSDRPVVKHSSIEASPGLPPQGERRTATRTRRRSDGLLLPGSARLSALSPPSAGDGSDTLASSSPVASSSSPSPTNRSPAGQPALDRESGGPRRQPSTAAPAQATSPAATPQLKRISVPSTDFGPARDMNHRTMSLTRALKAVTHDARHNSKLAERVEQWRERFSAHATELRVTADEWQARKGFERVLTMGFLSGAHPIVDLYELKVRLDHMLRRMRVLEEAAAAVAPVRVLDEAPLYLGNAVAADSHQVLRHLGITHILNATEEVALPPPAAGFTVLRLPLRDTDDEDITRRFAEANDFIDGVLGRDRGGARPDRSAQGPGVLVHCSEGRSRSVALVAAYLVQRRGMRLAPALALISSRRPEAAPNPGFSAALIALERAVFGNSSVEGATGITAQMAKDLLGAKKGKPEAARCPLCGMVVGLSSASVLVHIRTKHPEQPLPPP